MKQPACSRLWQAEAIEDGRLGGSDLASFHRHVQTCRVCSLEVERLRELGELASELPAFEATPLERRRQRQQLLRRANQLAVEPPPRVSRRVLAGAVVLAATTAMAAGGAYVLRPSTPSPSHATAPRPAAVARRAAHAVRQAPVAPPVQELAASRAAPGAVAPPGVARSAAARAQVAERTPAADPVHRTRSPREGLPALRRKVVVASARSGPALRRKVVAGAPGAPPPGAAPSPPTAGHDFAVAMQAFNSGNFGRAENLFTAFVQNHPGDSRAEDASFLRAVSSQRRGDTEDAKALAREYLQSYPGALRHEEAEAMLQR